MKYSPLVTHVDGFLASQLRLLLRFERAAEYLRGAWEKASEKDLLDDAYYWGAWALRNEIAKRWTELRDCGCLLIAHRQNGMWLAVVAEGGAA